MGSIISKTNMGSAERRSRQLASELPSFGSMGFKDKWIRAFPYHPLLEMCEIHLEFDYQEYQMFRLDKRIPSFEESLKIWWRKRFMDFVRKEYRLMNKVMPKNVKRMEEFFKDEPKLVNRWEMYKSICILIESKKDRFGNKKHDFEYFLQKEYLRKRKYQFLMRWTGLREEPFWRQRTRRQCLDFYQRIILWCPHWECWKIRIKHLHLIPYYWIRFYIYDKQHPELLDTH